MEFKDRDIIFVNRNVASEKVKKTPWSTRTGRQSRMELSMRKTVSERIKDPTRSDPVWIWTFSSGQQQAFKAPIMSQIGRLRLYLDLRFFKVKLDLTKKIDQEQKFKETRQINILFLIIKSFASRRNFSLVIIHKEILAPYIIKETRFFRWNLPKLYMFNTALFNQVWILHQKYRFIWALVSDYDKINANKTKVVCR